MYLFTYIWENSYQKFGIKKTITLSSEEEFDQMLKECNDRYRQTSWKFYKHPDYPPIKI